MAANVSTNTIASTQLTHRAAWAVGAMYALTTVHHVYGGLVDGAQGRLFVPVFIAIPLGISLGSLHLYGRTGSKAALNIFKVTTLVVFVLLLGVLHGVYAHTYKDVLFLLNGSPTLYYPLNPDEHYPPDNLFFELTGVLEVVAAYFVAMTTLALGRDQRLAVKS
jgi:hypothetical protein